MRKKVVVTDTMQHGYVYYRIEPIGRNFAPSDPCAGSARVVPVVLPLQHGTADRRRSTADSTLARDRAARLGDHKALRKTGPRMQTEAAASRVALGVRQPQALAAPLQWTTVQGPLTKRLLDSLIQTLPGVARRVGAARVRPTDLVDEVAKRLSERIANASKRGQTFRFTALDRGRVRKAPMDSLGVAGKNRTDLVRVVADGDHVVEMLAAEFLDMLGAVAGKVDSQLRHHRDRLGSNAARIRSR